MSTDSASIGIEKLIISLKSKLERQRKVANDTEEQIKSLETLAKSASDQIDLIPDKNKRR